MSGELVERIMKALQTKLLLSASLMLVIHPIHLSAAVINGPFVPGSGDWTLLPNGDFELGNIDHFHIQQGGPGIDNSISVDGIAPFAGSYSGVLSFNGGQAYWAFAISGAAKTLPLGGNYVLSGFVRAAVSDSRNTGRMDRFGDVGSESYFDTGNKEWQFVYEEFTNDAGFWYPRFVYSSLSLIHPMTVGDKLYIDEFALTPAHLFKAPTVRATGVPDGGGSALLTASGLAALALHRHRRK